MTDLKSAEERLLKLIKRLRQLGLDQFPDDETPLSPAQMVLLEQIAYFPGSGVGDIADHLELSPPTVSVGVSKLETRGLIDRKPDPVDGRSVQFFLTERGQRLDEKIHHARQEKLTRLLGGLDPQDQERFLRLLEQALTAAEEED